jgi:hypothetical protein
VPERLRPVDRMVAHTAFLIFGRPVTRRVRAAAPTGPAAEVERPPDSRDDAEPADDPTGDI